MLYLNFPRPDINHEVQQLSQFLQQPRQQYWDVADHLLRYLQGLVLMVFSIPLLLILFSPRFFVMSIGHLC